MRARGAQITDIVVLVVAANDGVMPQTREAIAHAKAAGVPIVVAINKIDLPDANPDRVKQQLSDLELIPEEWGGSTIFVEVSAKRKIGLEDLVEMILLQDERKARHISSIRQDRLRTKQLSQTNRVTLEDLYRRISAGEVKDLNLVIKADVQGSVQALWDAISKLESDKVRLRLIHGSTGAITESDVMLASASNAIVIGFSVRPIPKAAELAVQEHVDIRLYTVIYEAISDVETAMVGLLTPTYTEQTLGRAEVRMLFHISRV